MAGFDLVLVPSEFMVGGAMVCSICLATNLFPLAKSPIQSLSCCFSCRGRFSSPSDKINRKSNSKCLNIAF